MKRCKKRIMHKRNLYLFNILPRKTDSFILSVIQFTYIWSTPVEVLPRRCPETYWFKICRVIVTSSWGLNRQAQWNNLSVPDRLTLSQQLFLSVKIWIHRLLTLWIPPFSFWIIWIVMCETSWRYTIVIQQLWLTRGLSVIWLRLSKNVSMI